MNADTDTSYDRQAASGVLAELAAPGLFADRGAKTPYRIEFAATRLRPETGSHLTVSQRLYLEQFMRPCTAEQVTSATHRITWTDSDGIPNTGHCREDGFGPLVPVAAREAVLTLWHELASNTALADRFFRLTPRERAVLAGTTTDHEPGDIFRVGIESAGRVLAQHALLAAQTPYRNATEFARGIHDSGLFSSVATRWFWELQASTYRRGMIPAALRSGPNGAVRYCAQTVATLRAMKDATVADAHEVMHRATTDEHLSTEDAIAKYHDELDLISRQYALLAPGARSSCLAAMPHRVDDRQFSILPVVTQRLVDTFVEIVHLCELVESSVVPDDLDNGPIAARDRIFSVPDMTCKHCVRTIGGVLESMGIPVVDIDLDSKRVVAEFRSSRNRIRALEAIRDGGYNPVDDAGVRPALPDSTASGTTK